MHEPTDRAYLFTGHPDLLTFNFLTEKWETGTRTWLRDRTLQWWDVFSKEQMGYYTFHTIGDMLVFYGGADEDTVIGRNRLIVLDMKTKLWDVLSGTRNAVADNVNPSPKVDAVCWSIGRKLYIGYGNANLAAGRMKYHPEGDHDDYSYCDLWSWDFDKKGKWVKEKLRGNFPCHRTEVAHSYNRKWKSTIVYGGYAARISYKHPSKVNPFGFSYFADTFLWDEETKLWRMVIAKGFPTYRAGGDMVTDQETGRSYLFGGCK